MAFPRINRFLRSDMWRIRERDVTRPRWYGIRLLRILSLSFRGFIEDRCQLRASSLTFYSLLSIVPVVAMIFGIAKGFGFEKILERQLLEKLKGQEEVMSRVISFSHSLLDNTKGGIIAGIGVLILFWTIIKVLSNIENSFNDIWGVKKGRSLTRKISDYLSLMLICPLLFVTSSAATVLITGQIRIIISRISLLGPLSGLIFFALKFLPYCVIWVLFSFIYIFMPNTKVHFRSGMLSGIVAGTIYQFFQFAYINLQIGVAKYNAIYGSFAALPLFLIWMQASWIIVLSGAELSFAHQNVDTYEFEHDCMNVSVSFKKLISLRIVHLIVTQFTKGERALDEEEISHAMEVPIRLVRQILFDLISGGVVSPVDTDDEAIKCFQPGVGTDLITIKYVLDALDNDGTEDIPFLHTEETDKISSYLKDFGQLVESSDANVQLKNI